MIRLLLASVLSTAVLGAQTYTIETLALDAAGTGVAVDPAGNVYYTAFFGRQIIRLSPTRERTLFAGRNFGSGSSGDGGPAALASFSSATALAFDPRGDLYVYDDRYIRRIDSRGIISTVAGSGSADPSLAIGNGIPAVQLQLHVAASSGIALDPAGNLFIACSGYPALFRVASGTATVFAGLAGGDLSATPPAGFLGDNGPARQALLAQPNDLAISVRGDIWLLDAARLRHIDPSGMIRTLAGSSESGFSGDNGPASAARLRFPFGIAADVSGNLYLADTGNDRVRRIDAATGIITTIAGGGDDRGENFAGPATRALLAFPKQLAIDAVGTIYLASQHDATIRKLTLVREPRIAVGGVVNLAGRRPGPLTPGTAVSITGLNLNGPDLRVVIGGIEAPLLSAGDTEVHAIVPFATAPARAVPVSVAYRGHTSPSELVTVVEAAPAIFTLSGQGSGPAAILNQDGTVNSAAHPAAPGSIVQFYATGVGAFEPALADGQVVRRAVPIALPARVTVGGLEARVAYAGAAPGEIAGIAQVNVVVPPGVGGGAQPLVLQIGAVASSAVVTLTVR